MKFFPSLLCSSKWTLCLCLLLPTVSGLYSQTNDLAKLNEQIVEIQGLLNDGIILEAIRKLEDYLQQRPDDLAARKQICQAYLDLKDYFKLRYHTRIILQEFPEDSEALAWSATADEIIAEKYAVMVEDLLDALKDDPENTVLRRELISLYMTGDEGEKAAEQFRNLLALQPDDEALWLDFARNLFWSDQPEESLVAYQQYLAVAEEPKDVRLEIARVHAANADFGTAVDQLRALIEEVPDNYDAGALLGDIYRWNDDVMAAEEIYRAVLQKDPEHGPSLRGLEELAKMAQRKVITTMSMNIKSMREKVEDDPENMDMLVQLARLYTTNNRYPEGAETFARYLENRPDDLPVRREYAFTLSIVERYDEAIRQLRLYLQEFPDDMTERMRIARMLLWQGKNEAAKRELLEMEAIIPDNPELHWNLARIHEIESDWPRAIARYETLLEVSPRFEVASAKIRAIESNPYYRIATMERRIEADASDTAARLQLARIFLNLDRFYEAQEQAQAVLDYEPDQEQASRILGQAEIGVSQARRNRIEELKGILAEDTENFEAMLELARYYRDEVDYPEALRYYYSYLKAFPQDRQARLEYARVLSWEPEQRESAIREYAILIEDQPDNIDLRLTHLELLSAAGALTADDMTLMAEIEDSLRERLLTNREDAEALLFMGRLYQINSKWSEALDYYRSAIAASDRDASGGSPIRERIDAIVALPDYQLAQLFTQVEANPSDVLARLILARQLFDLKRYYEAREQASEVLVYDPGNVEASRIVGWSDIGIEEVLYERIRTARSNIDENPQDMEAALELARSLKEAEIYPESLRYYYHYLQAHPDDIGVREEYAQVLSWEPSQLPSAARELGILAEMRPDDMALQLQYYELLRRLGDLGDRDLTVLSAIEDRLRERVFFNDQDSEALFYLGRLHQIDGNWNSAIEYYEAAVAAGGEDTTAQNRLESILAMPDFQLAQFFAQVEANPSDVLMRLSLARQLFDLERYYEAREQANQALVYDPGNEEASRIIGWSDIGIEEVLNQRIRTARSNIRRKPEDMDVALELARLLKDGENYPESLRYYYHYLQAYPDDIGVREEYAQVLSWEPSQLPSAARELGILAEMRPDDMALQLQYYELLNRVGELSDRDLTILSAIEDRLRERVFFNDQDSEALFYLGRLHQIAENWNSALDYYEAAVAAGSGDTTVQNRIESILAMPDFQLARFFAQIEANPSDVRTRLSLARQLFDLGRYYEAREQANQALAYDPGNEAASRIINRSDIGIAEVQNQRMRTARNNIAANPQDMEAALELARLLKDTENYPESLRYYYHYLQAYPDDIEVREEYAQVLSWEPSQQPSAARELGVLAEMRPGDLTLQLQYYELLNSLGELNRSDLTTLSAIEDRLRERIYFNDQDSEALFYLGRLHQIEENWNSALDYYEAALAAGSQDTTIRNRIASITAAPDFQIASFESKVANNPDDIDLRLSLVQFLLQNNRYYAAQEQAEKVLQLSGSNREAREMYDYASQWIEGKQVADLQNLRFQVTENPRDLDAQLELARMIRNEGAYGEAGQRYRLYLQAYPEDLEVRREYADTLAWSGENSDAAINEYRDLLFAYPNDRELKMQYARMLSWNPKYWNEADEVLEELALLERNNPEILIMQADILRFRGRYGAAQLLYDQVLQMGSGVDGYYFDERGQRLVDERFGIEDRRNLGNASGTANRPSFNQPNVFENRGLAAEDFRSNNVIYEDSGRGINRLPARSIYRSNFDEEAVRRYRDNLLNTTPDSPQNSIRYPQGSLMPQAEPDLLQSGDDQNADTAHAASRWEESSGKMPIPEAMPEVAAVDEKSSSHALFADKKTEWRRPVAGDYKIVRAAMALDPVDSRQRGATNYAQRSTDALVGDERDEADRPRYSIRLTDPSLRPRPPAGTSEAQPAMTRETMRPPERYDPSKRVNVRDFFDEETQSFKPRRPGERAPRTYTIPGDAQVSVEQPAPIYTRPEPPRFSRERDRGVDARTDTSLPASTINDRRALDDLRSTPTRNGYNRTPMGSDPVGYTRERIGTPEIRDPYYDYRSTLPPPTRYVRSYEGNREPQSSSKLREPNLGRYDYTANVNSDRRSRFLEDDRMRQREMRAPTRERDSRNSLPPLRNDGLSNYYNSIEQGYRAPKSTKRDTSLDPVRRRQF